MSSECIEPRHHWLSSDIFQVTVVATAFTELHFHEWRHSISQFACRWHCGGIALENHVIEVLVKPSDEQPLVSMCGCTCTHLGLWQHHNCQRNPDIAVPLSKVVVSLLCLFGHGVLTGFGGFKADRTQKEPRK